MIPVSRSSGGPSFVLSLVIWNSEATSSILISMVYVCMYVRMYVCTYVCIYVFMYVCMYVFMYVRMQVTNAQNLLLHISALHECRH